MVMEKEGITHFTMNIHLAQVANAALASLFYVHLS
jgi:hypothetical protein